MSTLKTKLLFRKTELRQAKEFRLLSAPHSKEEDVFAKYKYLVTMFPQLPHKVIFDTVQSNNTTDLREQEDKLLKHIALNFNQQPTLPMSMDLIFRLLTSITSNREEVQRLQKGLMRYDIDNVGTLFEKVNNDEKFFENLMIIDNCHLFRHVIIFGIYIYYYTYSIVPDISSFVARFGIKVQSVRCFVSIFILCVFTTVLMNKRFSCIFFAVVRINKQQRIIIIEVILKTRKAKSLAMNLFDGLPYDTNLRNVGFNSITPGSSEMLDVSNHLLSRTRNRSVLPTPISLLPFIHKKGIWK